MHQTETNEDNAALGSMLQSLQQTCRDCFFDMVTKGKV